MATENAKLNELSIDIKKENIDKLNRGHSCRALASEYRVHFTTISRIGKNRNEILELWNGNCGKIRKRKLRDNDNEEINRTC